MSTRERFSTVIRNVLFSSPTDVGSHTCTFVLIAISLSPCCETKVNGRAE